MKRIGIFGGTSPESTVTYYQRITREYTRRYGNHGYPEILIFSVTFQQYIDWMTAGDWKALAAGTIDGLRTLSAGGAELGLIATNTFHKVFDEVAASVPIPLISILDVVTERLNELGCRRPALLGTGFTMSGSFYPQRLSRDGIKPISPTLAEQDAINQVIFHELNCGLLTSASKEALVGISNRLVAEGADAVILGCTELPLLVKEGDLPVPVLDTTTLHADAALEAALS